MEKPKSKNPLEWVVFVAKIQLFVATIFLVATIVSFQSGKATSTDTWRAHLALPPFYILFPPLFLYLYNKRSKYAWHTMMIFMISMLLYVPVYHILREYVIYHKPPSFWREVLQLVFWLPLTVAVLHSKPRYMRYLKIATANPEMSLEIERPKIVRKKLRCAGYSFLFAIVIFAAGILWMLVLKAERPTQMFFKVIVLPSLIAVVGGVYLLFDALLTFLLQRICLAKR